ncbi:hypothetical protein HY636_01510 [Candidatus Woesearchaeota archaeon]|nr:hypothetical protein [Candidatus Woesearchaeota archaeon]
MKKDVTKMKDDVTKMKDDVTKMKDDVTTAGVSSTSTVGIVGLGQKLQFDALVEQLSSLDKEKGDIHHDDRCGDEEECNNEGGIVTTEFVCYCNYDQRQQEANQKVQELLRQASDFADTHKIYNQEALKIHQRAGHLNEHDKYLDNLILDDFDDIYPEDITRRHINNINLEYITRCYAVAQSLGLVDLQLTLLEKSGRLEEGAEFAIKHKKVSMAIHLLRQLKNLPRLLTYAQEHHQEGVVLETLLNMDNVDGALTHAEHNGMHKDSLKILLSKKRTDEAIEYAEKYALHDRALEILVSSKRTDEAVRYAEKYALHDKALEILATRGRYEALFDYGAKHDCTGLVRMKSNELLKSILNENCSSLADTKAREMCGIMEHARELCAAMEHHQLQRSASLYREVIEEFERRVTAKRHISEYEEILNRKEGNNIFWLDVADLELSLGNETRYKKVWETTKAIWENRKVEPAKEGDLERRTDSISLAQSMIDNPRYHSQHEGLPKWRHSTYQLLKIALPLAELLEAENHEGEKKYPFLSLESVINAWGDDGINTFFTTYYDFFYYGRRIIHIDSKTFIFSDRYSDTVASEFMGKNLVAALESVHSSEAFTFIIYHFPYLFKTNFGGGKHSLLITSKDTLFNRMGELLEFIMTETAQDKEGTRRKIALENFLYVPANQLTQENIFAISTGGPDAVWKHIVSNEKKTETQTEGSFIDPRLKDIQQEYPHFDEATKKRMQQVFFEAYTSSEMTKALDRALTLYVELKQAYGKPMVFPAKHPLYFLSVLPSDEAERQDYIQQVMKEIYSVPERRKKIAETALERKLHSFFEEAFQLNGMKHGKLNGKLAEFLTASPQQLDVYLRALKDAKDMVIQFFELDATPKSEHESLPKWTFLEHYDHFSSAIIAESSSLFVPETLSKYTITTARPQGKKQGIRERMLREVDAICYLFREMYQIAQSQTFKEKASFRQSAVSSIVELWKEKQEKFLPSEVADTLAKFNFNRFFHGKDEPDEPIQRYLETAKRKQIRADSLFADQPDILFTRILDFKYYFGIKHGLSDDFINAINRLKNGLSTSWTFDELRLEFNENPLHNFFNNAAECTGNGGKYQRFGYAHMQDRNIGIIAANIYESGRHKSTVGKAFLARCHDRESKELLYVDGVVMLQDIADFLEEPNHEAHWLPLYTKAILQTARTHHLDETVFNASHKLAQRSVWQYIRHVAELLGLEEGKDFTYRQGRIDDGNTKQGMNVKTMSEQGFKFKNTAAQTNVHYLKKVPNESYTGEHLLEGYWINHYDPTHAKEPVSDTYGIVSPQDYQDIPQVNDAKGYIIGFRRSTQELIERFNTKYGDLYGKIEVT